MSRGWAGRKIGIAAAVGFAALLIPAAFAWACLPVASMTSSTANAQAGQSITVTGHEFYGTNPVLLHFDALGGPVLATITPDSNGDFSQSITIPADASPGSHVLVATENAATGTSPSGGSSAGVPSRTVVNVIGSGGSAPLSLGPSAAARPSGVVTSSSSVSGGALALVALGVLGVALFIAGGLALAIGGRKRDVSAETVRS